MRRLVTLGAVVALIAAPAAGIAFEAGTASALSGPAARAITGKALAYHLATVAPAGTVTVSALPKFTAAPRRTAVSIPLRRAPQRGSQTAGSVPAVADTVGAPQLTVAPGTPLSGTLGNGDNISVAGISLSPPDMGFSSDGTKEVELINVVGRIWTGPTAGTAFSLASFFSPGSPTDFLSDPWVKWDAGSSRWFGGIFDVSLGGEIMAVSTTSDPSGSWIRYRVRYRSTAGGITKGGCPDQGKGGVDNDVVGLGFNEFSASGQPGCPSTATYQGAGMEIFNKAEMMAGSTVDFGYSDPMPRYFSLVPADTLTTSATTEYFASLDPGPGTTLHRMTSTGVPGVSTGVTLTILSDINVPKYTNPPKALQNGTTTKIDSGDDRTQNVVVLGNDLALDATVGCLPTNDTAKRACGRIYEVDNSANSGAGGLSKSLTISAINTHFIYPALTMFVRSGTNTVGVGIGQSTSSTFGSLYTTAGNWGQALATPVLVKSGTALNKSGRYGDYFAAAPQPGTSQFWVSGEIGSTSGSGSVRWGTAAASVAVS